MEEIKFKYAREEPVSPQGSLECMFGGPYKFSTQSTVVADSYVLVNTGKALVRIEMECDKAFYRNGSFCAVSGTEMTCYTDWKLTGTRELGASVAFIDDFMTPENLSKVLEKPTHEGVQGYFTPNDSLVEVHSTKIVFAGQEYPNTISSPGATYFLAHATNVAVLGNTQSSDFLYFLCGKLVETE